MSKPNELSTLFAGIISQAAKTPTTTGATDRYRQRLDRAGTETIILLDVSTSMAQHAGSRTKIDILRDALDHTLSQAGSPVRPRLIAFSSFPQEIATPADLPAPHGSTALHLALEAAEKARPRHTLVVSDGRPDYAQKAMDVAGRLSGVIDVLYVGPDDDYTALAFMRELARKGGGRIVVHDIKRNTQVPQLMTAIRGLLPAPGASG